MKKNRNTFIFITAAMVLSLVSCKKEFVDLTPKGQFLTANYYQNEDQAYAALVGVYDIMRKNSGGFENMITMMNAGSDDQYAGGGGATDGAGIQAFSNFSETQFTVPGSYWNDYYQGIFKANILLLKLPTTTMDEALKARFIAETKALRGMCYFNLVTLFKNIPLIVEPLAANDIYNVVQADPADVYAQIEKDLTEAIAVLPPTISATEYGRFTKGAAQALLGKVYLYEKKNDLAAAQLAEVNGTPGGTSQYGYKLLSNYSDLWVVANKMNSEGILITAHTNLGLGGWGNWGSGTDEGNSICVMVGPRGYTKVASPAPDLPSGWSFNVFTDEFYNAIKLDPRFSSTVFDMKALNDAGLATYIEGYKNTGYFFKKYMPTQADVTTLGGDAVLNYKQDSYVIRLADTYLMEAEALGGTGQRAQDLLNAVRARVGLLPVTVSLAAIKAERRLELAGEGNRFFDLVRWGDAATRLLDRGFTPNKNEVFPIPNAELLGTKLVQNTGYNQ
ncbi:MAG: RagB/SusD family nutrient uptake outer membrane protein [Bacteroidales bacterium]|nr:RagB/SusD family nutrient uptake outer membrane protein [Bacteroidales bacterium]